MYCISKQHMPTGCAGHLVISYDSLPNSTEKSSLQHGYVNGAVCCHDAFPESTNILLPMRNHPQYCHRWYTSWPSMVGLYSIGWMLVVHSSSSWLFSGHISTMLPAFFLGPRFFIATRTLLVGLGVVAALPAVGQAERHGGDRRKKKGPSCKPTQLWGQSLGTGGAVPVMGRFMGNKWRYSYVLICFNIF